jgi:hypothetical protein
MKMCKRFIWIAVFIGLTACSDALTQNDGFYILNYWVDFNDEDNGWTGDFADYPATEYDSAEYELKIEHTALPAYLVNNKKGLLISGNNYCDDLFMYIKKKIDGLQPSTEYTIVFSIEIASNAPTGSIDGGKPGEGVFLKAGAVSTEPKKVIEGEFYRMNIDKGNHGTQGEDMKVIGNIAVSATTDAYTFITRSNSSANQPLIVRSNSKGELWLIIGTDSDYEGLTSIYYTGVNVVLSISD